jgi:hypothetical protein
MNWDCLFEARNFVNERPAPCHSEMPKRRCAVRTARSAGARARGVCGGGFRERSCNRLRKVPAVWRPPWRITSRLTVEGARPKSAAILRIDGPFERPREMTSRSAIDNDRADRRRTGGAIPPREASHWWIPDRTCPALVRYRSKTPQPSTGPTVPYAGLGSTVLADPFAPPPPSLFVRGVASTH